MAFSTERFNPPMESCWSTYHATAGEAFLVLEHSTVELLLDFRIIQNSSTFCCSSFRRTHHVPLYKVATPVVPLYSKVVCGLKEVQVIFLIQSKPILWICEVGQICSKYKSKKEWSQRKVAKATTHLSWVSQHSRWDKQRTEFQKASRRKKVYQRC